MPSESKPNDLLFQDRFKLCFDTAKRKISTGGFQILKRVHLGVGQLKAVELCILPLALLADTLRDDGCATLGTPSEQDLGWGLFISGGDFLDQIVLHEAVLWLCHRDLDVRG